MIMKLNLPKMKFFQIDQIMSFIKNDKKKTSHGLNFILLDEIGKAHINKNISYNDIKRVLKSNEYISY